MELETIDDHSSDQLPEEAVQEIKSMSTWMTFSGVMFIIINILSILGNLSILAKASSPSSIVSIMTGGISVYLGFLILKKSSLFNNYGQSKNETELMEAMKVTKQFWMLSVLLTILSFVTSIIFKQI